jgi:pimeloyl-ACP methyl ester carboxylesterase
VDILGYSLGGIVSQVVTLNADPKALKVRKLILAATGPRAGAGIEKSPNQDVSTWAGAKDLTIDTRVLYDDYMIPTMNSLVIQQKAPNAELLVYPNSGHGFCFSSRSYS